MRLNIKYSSLCLLLAVGFSSCSNSSVKSETNPDNGDGFVEMLDQNTLQGWKGDEKIWEVKDGVLTGQIREEDEPLTSNSFIIWEGGEPADFELKGSFRISANGNSGINYRSERYDAVPFALKGYQADIDGQNNYTGQNYEERKRTTLAYRGQSVEIPEQEEGKEAASENNAWSNVKILDSLGEQAELKSIIKSEDWNTIRIVAQGNKLQHYINDVLMSEVLDNDSQNRALSGLIGIQVHVGPPMKVEYKNLMIKKFDK